MAVRSAPIFTEEINLTHVVFEIDHGFRGNVIGRLGDHIGGLSEGCGTIKAQL